MATTTIVNITGTPSLSTSNSAGGLIQPGVSSTIWDPLNNYIDGTGSTNPVTFLTPAAATQPYSPQLTVNLIATLTSQYSGAIFDLVGSVTPVSGIRPINVLTSVGNVMPPIPNPPVPVPTQVSKFEFHSDLKLANSCPVPFRVAGDFQWKLVFKTLPAITVILPTRLEICYARAVAPTGSAYTTNPVVTQTGVNLKGIYPIGLLRFCLPSPSDFNGIANFDQASVFAPWFAARVAQQVWSWGSPRGRLKYDALNGRSQYNMTILGGGFNLENWLASKYITCNCYDLAAIMQLGCCLLLSSAGYELLDSRWVYQEPNGYINQCELFGWSATYPLYPGVNNPFFLNSNPPNPYVKPNETGREPFGDHAWIEVLHDPFDQSLRTVLDATTAVQEGNRISPDDGTRSRTVYKRKHIDVGADPSGKDTGNIRDRIFGAPSSGDCYVNYSYYTTSSTYPPNALGRIGVFNADGMDPPLLLEQLNNLPKDTGIMSEIEILLSKGQNPDKEPSMFNDASMKIDRLEKVVAGDSDLRLIDSRVKVTQGTSLLTARFAGARYTETVSAVLVLQVHVFDNFNSARLALIKALTSFSPPGPLSDFLRALTTPLGETSLLDINGQTLLIVRGNYMLQLRLAANEVVAPDPKLIHPLEPIGRKLDSYLAAKNLPSGKERVPSISLTSPIRASVKVGEAFVLETDHEYAVANGRSSNGAVVVCAGPRTGGESGIEFFALAEGEVEISLDIAHEDTLLPVTKSWNVKVE